MPKPCPSEKIRNPKTGRCVSRSGKIGQKLLAEKKSPKKSPNKSPNDVYSMIDKIVKWSIKTGRDPRDSAGLPDRYEQFIANHPEAMGLIMDEIEENKPKSPANAQKLPRAKKGYFIIKAGSGVINGVLYIKDKGNFRPFSDVRDEHGYKYETVGRPFYEELKKQLVPKQNDTNWHEELEEDHSVSLRWTSKTPFSYPKKTEFKTDSHEYRVEWIKSK